MNMLYISPYTLFLAIIVVVLVLTRIIQICQIRRIRRRQQRRAEERWNEILSGSNLLSNGVTVNFPRGGGAVPVPISLNNEDRIKLYKRTFEQSKLNRTLNEQDFKPNENSDVETNNNFHQDIESACDQGSMYYNDDDDEEAPTLYLDLTKDTSTDKKCNHDNHDNHDDNHNNDENATLTATNTKFRTKITGTCIICFEHFRIGDIVVKSENTDACQHIFHEDCMVRFLASNSERNKPTVDVDNNHNNNHNNRNSNNNNLTSYSDNPCPTCRHPFCTVSQDDIVLSVLLKSMRMAILQNQNQQTNDRTNESIDEPEDAENPPSTANLSVIPEESSQDIETTSDVLNLTISNPDQDERDEQDSQSAP